MTEPAAGPALDLAVGRLLYGRQAVVRTADGSYLVRAPGQEWGSAQPVPPYSTDIRAAWAVFLWGVQMTGHVVIRGHGDRIGVTMGDQTAVAPVCEALCRAALACQAAAAGEELTAE